MKSRYLPQNHYFSWIHPYHLLLLFSATCIVAAIYLMIHPVTTHRIHPDVINSETDVSPVVNADPEAGIQPAVMDDELYEEPPAK